MKTVPETARVMLSPYADARLLSLGRFVLAFVAGATLMVSYLLYLLFTLFPNSYLAIELWFLYHADKTPTYFAIAAGIFSTLILACILLAWLTYRALQVLPSTASTSGVSSECDVNEPK